MKLADSLVRFDPWRLDDMVCLSASVTWWDATCLAFYLNPCRNSSPKSTHQGMLVPIKTPM